MRFIPELLEKLGIHSEKWISVINVALTLLIAVIAAWLVYVVVAKLLYKGIGKMSQKTPTRWDNLFFDKRLFRRLALMLVPVTLMLFIEPFTAGQELLETVTADGNAVIVAAEKGSPFWNVIYKLLSVWTAFAVALLLRSVMDGANRIYESYPGAKDRPIKIFIQLIAIFLYAAAVMVAISIFSGVSVAALLGGLAVVASVLMLVFKDTILGFVAGIQLSANDMLHIGDWIEMPSKRADGDVLEIGLTSVKVQNWDKTITTIPTYQLVSESFTNWRGMEQSGGRRIKRSVNIDVNSIRHLSDADIEKLKDSSLLKEYIEKKQSELRDFNANRPAKLDERRLTNVGTFREYMESWLAHNPDINQEMTHMVRQLQPGPTGLPLEVYCFSARKAWIVYEKVQSDLFDHFYAVMELFDLRAFQYPATQARAARMEQMENQPFVPIESE